MERPPAHTGPLVAVVAVVCVVVALARERWRR
jgi:hypothetical protein